MQLPGFCSTGTKYSLWFLIALQIIFIGIYWLFQEGFNIEFKYATNRYKKISHVSFIQKNKTLKITTTDIDWNISNFKIHLTPKRTFKPNENKTINLFLKTTSNFNLDFIIFTESGKHLKTNISCYRQGTQINTFLSNNDIIQNQINGKHCRCQPEWHGKDCGQPEVVWRALMTSKEPLGVRNSRNSASEHKIIYMIIGYFLSLELLEIQILELESSVDFFILCQKSNYQRQTNRRSTLKNLLKIKFTIELLDRFLIVTHNTDEHKSNHSQHLNFCSPKSVYNEFKKRILNIENALKPDDIFIYSYDDEILNRRAVKYFKYYNDTLERGVIRFRLKYNVYGFYWQHPESTRLGSALCSIQQLEDHFKSDPERMFNVKKPSMIIGDLNHIGGWYCRYCYQASEIIEKLTTESSNLAHRREIIFPKSIKNGQIDVSYIENLIATGLFVDGKLSLNKLQRFSDKYFAPEYVEQNGWKYDNILINLYLSFNDDNEY